MINKFNSYQIEYLNKISSQINISLKSNNVSYKKYIFNEIEFRMILGIEPLDFANAIKNNIIVYPFKYYNQDNMKFSFNENYTWDNIMKWIDDHSNKVQAYKLVDRISDMETKSLLEGYKQELQKTPGYKSEYYNSGRVSLNKWLNKLKDYITPDIVHNFLKYNQRYIQNIYDDSCGLNKSIGHHRQIDCDTKAFSIVSLIDDILSSKEYVEI